MTVYVRKVEPPTDFSVSPFTLLTGFYLRGEEIVQYSTLDEIGELAYQDIIVDYVFQMQHIFNLMNIKVRPIDYPNQLQTFYGRKIEPGTISQIFESKTNWNVFIKPKADTKLFEGRVVRTRKDLIGLNVTYDYPIWISEPVQFVCEWRCFILNHHVLDVRPYKGDYHVQYDPTIIDAAVATWKEAPSACSIDISVTADNRTLVVEANDGFSLGTYGLNPYQAAVFHETRWREITQAYFQDHQTVKVRE